MAGEEHELGATTPALRAPLARALDAEDGGGRVDEGRAELLRAACLDEDALVAFAEGRLPARARTAAAEHLEACSDCRAIVTAIAPVLDAAEAAAVSETGSEEKDADAARPTPAGEPAELRPGAIVGGRYCVERKLGAGGMGVVYEATHLTLGTRVALKLVRASRVENAEMAARFLREARTAARLTSPHVCRVLDAGEAADGRLFAALELLEGEDLAKTLGRRGRLPWREAVALLRQACAGLAEAHALGIAHRDVKPANLFRLSDGQPGAQLKILDFGLATTRPAVAGAASSRLTSDSRILGSPAYMAPEQIRAPKDVDARVDVWALGVVLHELVSGSLPFDAETAGALWAKVLSEAPARLDPAQLVEETDARGASPGAAPDAAAIARRDLVGRRLQTVIDRCLARAPEDRFPNVGALDAGLAALERGEDPEPASSRPPPGAAPSERPWLGAPLPGAPAYAVVLDAGRAGAVPASALRSSHDVAISLEAPALVPVIVHPARVAKLRLLAFGAAVACAVGLASWALFSSGGRPARVEPVISGAHAAPAHPFPTGSSQDAPATLRATPAGASSAAHAPSGAAAATPSAASPLASASGRPQAAPRPSKPALAATDSRD